MGTAKCKGPGIVVPVIDRERCEGKNDCVEVCPYDVFEMRLLDADQKRALSLKGRWKALFHGNRQAFVVHGDACQACGLCTRSCPEQAIRLVAAAR